MKILIVSDTHKKNGNLQQVIEKEKPFDMLIHLGDSEGAEYILGSWLDEGCDLEMVLGNNDFFSRLEREKELQIGPYKALLTHGHYYTVSLGVEYLVNEARAAGIDIAMFGHTHKPFYEIFKKRGEKDLLVMNPGSLSYPRQEGRRPSYMIMELDEENEIHLYLHYL